MAAVPAAMRPVLVPSAVAAPADLVDRLRLLDRLRELAGDKVFARGNEYKEDGQVEIVSIDCLRVLARVVGSKIYRSELRGTGKKFSGSCSCPAFSDWGFCKHLVATALAANELGPDAAERAANHVSKFAIIFAAKAWSHLSI